MLHELIAAGVEGGSKRRLREEWSLSDVRDQKAIWKKLGPPNFVSSAALAGFKPSQETDSREVIADPEEFMRQAMGILGGG